MFVCSTEQKPLLILHLLHNMHIVSALCFTKSVESAHRLCMLIRLFEKNYENMDNGGDVKENAAITAAAEYSSDLSQAERNAILRRFKKGEIRLYVFPHL